LRRLDRASLGSPQPAPHSASASALIKAWINVDNKLRSKSGLAVASWSANSF
jgi:hypothetical protein